jgi:hypothetical protein
VSRLQERLARFDAEVGLTDADRLADAIPHLPDTPLPSPVHLALVNLMDEVLGMAKEVAHEGGPGFTALAVAMRTFHKMRGTALESLAQVPEGEIRAFLDQLARKLIDVCNAGYELTTGGGENGDTRPDQLAAQGTGDPDRGDPGRQVDPI